MKSHTVKSNAKRAARKLVEQFPGLIAVEPLAVKGGGYHAAVGAIAGFDPRTLPAGTFNDFQFIGPDGRIGEPVPYEPEAVDIPRFLRREPTTVGADFGEADAVTVMTDTSVLTEGFKQPEGNFIVTGRGDSSGVKRVPDAVAAVAAEKAAKVKTAKDAKALPARVTSTPEDIAARLAARRQRIAEAKANPAAAPAKPAKETMGDVIVKLCSRPEGATSEQLQEATKWQAHTLRGYIAGTLRKRGHDIKLTRGKPSIYRIEQTAA